MKSPGVYRIYCTETRKTYVGSSSKDWRGRLNWQLSRLRAGVNPCAEMQADWNRYGEEAFQAGMVVECGEGEIGETERTIESRSLGELYEKAGERSERRFRAGRPKVEGAEERVRFSRMVTVETAKKLAEVIAVEKRERMGMVLKPKVEPARVEPAEKQPETEPVVAEPEVEKPAPNKQARFIPKVAVPVERPNYFRHGEAEGKAASTAKLTTGKRAEPVAERPNYFLKR